MPDPAAHGSAASAAFASTISTSIPASDVQQLTRLQAETHDSLRSASEQLSTFNRFSAEQHAVLSARFSEHVISLNALHANLMNVYRRTRAIRKHLLEQHPELQAAARAADAQREAEIEQAVERRAAKEAAPLASALAATTLGAGPGVLPSAEAASARGAQSMDDAQPPRADAENANRGGLGGE